MILDSIGGTLTHVPRAIAIYRTAGERAGHPERLRAGISTYFFAGATPEAARAVYPYCHEYLRLKTPGGRSFRVDRSAFEAGTRREGALKIGAGEDLVGTILSGRQVPDMVGACIGRPAARSASPPARRAERLAQRRAHP